MSQIDPGDIKACVFDAYGTLFDLGSITARHADRLGGHVEPLAALWRRKQLEYTWLRSLMGRHADFWHLTGESLDCAMATLGLTDASLRAALMEAFLTPAAYAEASTVLDRLRHAGRKTAILSNGTPLMLAAAVNAANLREVLDGILSVEDVGIYKPHPSVYELACDRLAVPPHAVLFVSGNFWDAAGAAAFGFRAVWINRQGAPADALPGHPAAEIRDLLGVLPLLGL